MSNVKIDAVRFTNLLKEGACQNNSQTSFLALVLKDAWYVHEDGSLPGCQRFFATRYVSLVQEEPQLMLIGNSDG